MIGDRGVAYNVASGPGMSGGPCFLNNNPDQVFGIVSNAFHSSDVLNPSMPRLWFHGKYVDGGARYISMFHVLDQRMKKELGYGLDKISEKCR